MMKPFFLLAAALVLACGSIDLPTEVNAPAGPDLIVSTDPCHCQWRLEVRPIVIETRRYPTTEITSLIIVTDTIYIYLRYCYRPIQCQWREVTP